MNAAASARILAALSLVCASYARADDRSATPAAPAPSSGATARDGGQRAAGRGAGDPKQQPPAVLMLPLIGLVLLPLTLPVSQPRVRINAQAGPAASPSAAPASVAPAASAAAADLTAQAAPRAPEPPGAACAGCGAARQGASEPGAHP
jgi:hypothetical protein